MVLRPIQGDEKQLSMQRPLSMEAPPSPLSSRAYPDFRDDKERRAT